MMLEYISLDAARLDPGALRFYDGEFDSRTAQIEFAECSLQSAMNDKTVSEANASTANCTLQTANSITGSACYWDPSGGREKADSSVIVLLYRDDKNRRAFIHDVRYLIVRDEDLHPLATQCDAVLDFMQAHKQRKIAIEVNGLGNALPEILRDAAQKRGIGILVQKIINHQRKEDRILDAIEPLLTTGRLYAHERIKSTPLLAEMLGWSPMMPYQNDDGLDAVAGALRLQATPIRTLSAAMGTLKARTEFKV